MANINVIQALHNILRRESEKPDGKGESIEHAALREMLNPETKAMLSDDLKQRTKKEYPEKFSGTQS
jgi:hypothetical protein